MNKNSANAEKKNRNITVALKSEKAVDMVLQLLMNDQVPFQINRGNVVSLSRKSWQKIAKAHKTKLVKTGYFEVDQQNVSKVKRSKLPIKSLKTIASSLSRQLKRRSQ